MSALCMNCISLKQYTLQRTRGLNWERWQHCTEKNWHFCNFSFAVLVLLFFGICSASLALVPRQVSSYCKPQTLKPNQTECQKNIVTKNNVTPQHRFTVDGISNIKCKCTFSIFWSNYWSFLPTLDLVDIYPTQLSRDLFNRPGVKRQFPGWQTSASN